MKSNKNDMLECIKGFCESCSGDGEPENCCDIKCPMHDLRNGGENGTRETKIKNSIKNRCLECSGDDARVVLLCESYTCDLWEWRTGSGDRLKKPKTYEDQLFETEEDLDEEDLLFG